MQTGKLCDQDRMFEVYLNVAEWGPGIYGIQEAAVSSSVGISTSWTVPLPQSPIGSTQVDGRFS